MRITTTNADLPTMNDVEKYLHNEFIGWLKGLKNDIKVSDWFLPEEQKRLTAAYFRLHRGKSRQQRMVGQLAQRRLGSLV